MRLITETGFMEWEVLPFLPLERDALCTTITVPVEDGAALWYIVLGFELTFTLHIDPATSDTSLGTYTRSLFLERQLYDEDLEEWNTLFPWFDLDEEYPLGFGGSFEHEVYNGFKYTGSAEVGDDDVFFSTSLTAELKLFAGGYGGDGVGNMDVTLKLRVAMTFDDGTEGIIYFQSIPVDDPDPFDDSRDGTATLNGYSFQIRMGTNLPDSSTWFQQDADVELVPALWFEYRKADGSEPIYDSATGAQLTEPRTLEE